jgi:hypothetical protein
MSRVRGRAALTTSLQRILIRTHRFGRARARTQADFKWSAVVIDTLDELLATLAALDDK